MDVKHCEICYNTKNLHSVDDWIGKALDGFSLSRSVEQRTALLCWRLKDKHFTMKGV